MLPLQPAEEEWNLDEVIETSQLSQRPPRKPDLEGESQVTNNLLRELAKSPEDFFPKLVSAILTLSSGDSAGVSLLDEERKKFVWPAVTGGLASYVGAGTPMDFGPCGTVLDRDTAILFVHPERHFGYLKPIDPPLREVLLHPFHLNGKAVGTIWAVIHEPGRQFDAEDKRLLGNLSRFAASAYHVLAKTGALKAIMDIAPLPPSERRLTQDDGKWQFAEGGEG